MEWVADNRYVCREHGFDKSAVAKSPSKEHLIEAVNGVKQYHLKQLEKEFGCTDPVVTTKIKEFEGVK